MNLSDLAFGLVVVLCGYLIYDTFKLRKKHEELTATFHGVTDLYFTALLTNKTIFQMYDEKNDEVIGHLNNACANERKEVLKTMEHQIICPCSFCHDLKTNTRLVATYQTLKSDRKMKVELIRMDGSQQ